MKIISLMVITLIGVFTIITATIFNIILLKIFGLGIGLILLLVTITETSMNFKFLNLLVGVLGAVGIFVLYF